MRVAVAVKNTLKYGACRLPTLGIVIRVFCGAWVLGPSGKGKLKAKEPFVLLLVVLARSAAAAQGAVKLSRHGLSPRVAVVCHKHDISLNQYQHP